MAEITRKEFINLSFKSFIGIASTLPILNSCTNLANEPESEIAWQDFLSEVSEMAAFYEKPGFDEEAYLKKVVKLARRLNLETKEINNFYKNYSNRRKNFPEFKRMHKEKAFAITLLEFEPGEKIPLHDHPDMSGVILCSSGDIDIKNYDLLPRKSENKKLLLKQVSSVRMQKGMIDSLSSKRGNIHSLKANKFTRLIDIFTPPYDKRRIQESHYFSKDPKNYKGQKNIFEARYA